MDLYKNELKDRIYVIDSSQVVGAQVILNWIKKKRELVKDAQRKISLARRKTLFSKGISKSSELGGLELTNKLSGKQDQIKKRNSVLPSLRGSILKFKIFGDKDKKMKWNTFKEDKLTTDDQPKPSGKEQKSKAKTVKLAAKFAQVD